MSGKGIYFYATRSDMETVITKVEKMMPLLYTAKGLFSAPQREFDSALSLPQFGTLHHGHHALELAYVVVPREQPIEVRQIEQQDGTIRFAVDQLKNPQSIVFQPSGIYGSAAIIMGAVTTTSSDPVSTKLYKVFSRSISDAFEKMNSAYVGPEAMLLAKQGYRLTNDINRPITYDLKV